MLLCLTLVSVFHRILSNFLKKEVFTATLIKKQKYWPKYINEDGIREHFKDKEIGTFDAMKVSLDGFRVEVHYLKEPEYVMMLVSPYNTLERVNSEKKIVRINECSRAPIEETIKYPEIFFQ